MAMDASDVNPYDVPGAISLGSFLAVPERDHLLVDDAGEDMDFPVLVLCYSASRIVMVGACREWDSASADFTS